MREMKLKFYKTVKIVVRNIVVALESWTPHSISPCRQQQMRSLLKHRVFQNVLRGCHKSAAFESLLKDINEKSPKQGYSLVFFDEEVQQLLKNVTNINLEKVFRAKPRGTELKPPVYKLMTTEELEQEKKSAWKIAEELLQIPPLVNITEDKVDVLDADTSLDGYDQHHSKHVFIDISYNKSNHNRAIVVREANGVLRTALKSERSRVNQIYFPIPGREIETPHMFEYENLIEVIKRKDYEFILDRACTQFEPDTPEYHKVISLTYEAINYWEDFEVLHSTRHFGSLVFYLVSHKNIDKMLNDNICKDRIEDAFSLVKLYHIVHPNCKSAQSSAGKTEMEVLKEFIQSEAKDRNTLLGSLNSFLERQSNEKEYKRGVKEAHGL